MSLLWMEGFEWVNSAADLALRYDSILGITAQQAGRVSGFSVATSNGATVIQKNLGSNRASWVIGLGFFHVAGASARLIYLLDSTSLQCELRTNASNQLLITRNGSQASITNGTSTVTLSAGWNYVEWKVTIANSSSADSCIVMLNGVEVINVTAGSDLQNTANAFAQTVGLGNTSSATYRFDDWYVLDQSGSVNNDFLGDSRVITLYPDGNGNSTQWTPIAGTNYENVDDATPDADSTYNFSSTVGHTDLYTFGNAPAALTTIHGIQTGIVARKDDAGSREFARVIRTNSTNYDGTTVTLTDSYVSYAEVQEQNPNTSSAWTVSDINAIEAGIKVVT